MSSDLGLDSGLISDTDPSLDRDDGHRRSSGPKKPRWQRRRIRVVGVFLGILGLLGSGWFAAAMFQSPAQREASAKPPELVPVVIAVKRGDLRDETTTIATLSGGTSTEVVLSLPSEERAVITRTPIDVGGQVTSGSVGLWISDRPVFFFPGRFPAFRDMTEGDVGGDVAQLQAALNHAGYQLTEDGEFGPSTTEAVRDLYAEVGLVVPTVEVDSPAPVAPARENPTPGSSVEPSPNTGTESNSTGAAAKSATKELVTFPMSELSFVPFLPAAMAAVPPVGTVLEGNATIRIESTDLVLRAQATQKVAQSLSDRASGTAVLEGTEVQVELKNVEAVTKEGIEGMEADTEIFYLTFAPKNGTYPADWSGKEVLIRLNISDPLEDVLLVPQRAIAINTQGESRVLVKRADLGFVPVPVVEIGCISGTCAVAESDQLAEGTIIRVDGQNTESAGVTETDQHSDQNDDDSGVKQADDSSSGA